LNIFNKNQQKSAKISNLLSNSANYLANYLANQQNQQIGYFYYQKQES